MSDRTNNKSIDWKSLVVEQTGTAVGQCDCCGTATKRVWGLVSDADAALAAYFVAWTVGKPDHGATFDFILGKWGDNTTTADRYTVALDFRLIDGSPQFMVVDGKERLPSQSKLADTVLSRSDVIGTALAPQVFAIVDALYFGGGELEQLQHWV